MRSDSIRDPKRHNKTKIDLGIGLMADAEQAAALRIIDANGNRATEGLRVVEDYLRFHRNDAHLSQLCKQIRHQVSETLASMFAERAHCRSTNTDVGVSNTTSTEYERRGLQHVVVANLRRVTEALRTLEEYGKLGSAEAAKSFEACRYKAYTLEKCVGHLERSLVRLAEARIYALVDLRFGAGEQFALRIEQMLSGGVDVVQLRDKNATDRELVEAGRRLRMLTNQAFEASGKTALFIMNDRPDIACVVDADGVHVGQDELLVVEARSIVGADRLVGVSTHSLIQARSAVKAGADYLGVGPVFRSTTKQFDEFVGTELVEQVAAEIALPWFAIGGVNQSTLPAVLQHGARRVAIGDAIWGATDVGQAARELELMFGTGKNDD